GLFALAGDGGSFGLALELAAGGVLEKDLAFGDAGNQFADTRGCGSTISEIESPEGPQAPQFCEPGVWNFVPVEAELCETGPASGGVEAGVGDVPALKIQAPQLRQTGEVWQSGIGDRGIGEIELSDVDEP